MGVTIVGVRLAEVDAKSVESDLMPGVDLAKEAGEGRGWNNSGSIRVGDV
jgi:hypothetical protein